MTAAMTVTALPAGLGDAAGIVAEELAAGLAEAEAVLLRAVRERTPVDTGALRDSLAVQPAALSGTATDVAVGSPLPYARAVELGIRPNGPAMPGARMAEEGLEASRPHVASILEAATLRALHRMGTSS